MKILKKDKQGITLIELLVVLAIISILALIAYTSLSEAREEARKASVKASMDGLVAAAEIYALGKEFTYENFCDDKAVANVEKSCQDIYGGKCECIEPLGELDGLCEAKTDSWKVRCDSPGLTWTCTNDGCGIGEEIE